MQVSVLGPVEVRDNGQVVQVAGSRVRRLLVRLAVDAPAAVSFTELVDAVWYDDDAPSQVANALQSLVSRLRRALASPGAIQQTTAGYRLIGCEIDIAVFDRLASEGRRCLDSGDASGAATLLREALELWSGRPLSDAGEAEYAIGLSAKLTEQAMEVICDRIDADLALGKSAQLVAELEELTAGGQPRERLVAQQMTALARTGRTAEALAIYAKVRERLAEDFGADPSAALQQAHLKILRGQAGPLDTTTDQRAVPRASLTTFVGRENELKRIHELLSGGRLSTIVGPGGAGKTRLATEAARAWPAPSQWDGDWLVELAPITDEASLVQAFLTSLGIRETRLTERPTERPASRDPMSRLVESLRDTRCLLVVDNCEHLIDGVARLLARLLSSCPHVRVLATSREPLGIDGESLCVVPPLALPPPGAAPEEARSFPSVQLLADRASAVQADFEINGDNVGAVVEIVRRLDGLPLAIELAAARLRVLPVAEVAARLSDRFRLLTGGNRAAMPRHRTLRAVVEWSWDLLSTEERLLAERLAVFPAGASVPSARAVCGNAGLDAEDVPALLDSLVDKSLLHVSDEEGLRYRMLETIREYGVERLAERGELAAIRHSHAAHFADVVADAAPRLRTPDQLAAFGTIEREHDNIVAALRFLGDSGETVETLELACDMSWYWMLRNEHSDAVVWLTFACSVPGGEELDLHLLAEAGIVLNEMAGAETFDASGQPGRVDQMAEIAVRLRTLPNLGERFEPQRALLQIGLALLAHDDDSLAVFLTEGLASSDPWTRAAVRTFRAAVAENKGDVVQMRADVGGALEDFRALGDRWGLATTLTSYGYLLTLDGHLAAAGEAYEEAAVLMEQLGARADGGFLRLQLAGLRLRQSDFDGAKAHINAVLVSARGRSETIATLGKAMLAGIAALEGDQPLMRQLRGEVLDHIDRLDSSHPINGHGHAISLGTVSQLYANEGDTETARHYATRSYPVAVGTHDQPIIAMMGVAVASLAYQLGALELAAELLGCCAVLRGGDDPTEPTIRSLSDRLRLELDGGFDEAYARGKAMSHEEAIAAVSPESLPPPA